MLELEIKRDSRKKGVVGVAVVVSLEDELLLSPM